MANENCYAQTTHHSDRMQDEWFTNNSLRLVRITDKELRRSTEHDIIAKIQAALVMPPASQASPE